MCHASVTLELHANFNMIMLHAKFHFTLFVDTLEYCLLTLKLHETVTLSC